MGKWERVATALHEEVDGEAVIVDGPSGNMVTINVVGRLIWEKLDEPRTIEELVDMCSAVFTDVERDVLHADVTAFVHQIRDLDLVIER